MYSVLQVPCWVLPPQDFSKKTCSPLRLVILCTAFGPFVHCWVTFDRYLVAREPCVICNGEQTQYILAISSPDSGQNSQCCAHKVWGGKIARKRQKLFSKLGPWISSSSVRHLAVDVDLEPLNTCNDEDGVQFSGEVLSVRKCSSPSHFPLQLPLPQTPFPQSNKFIPGNHVGGERVYIQERIKFLPWKLHPPYAVEQFCGTQYVVLRPMSAAICLIQAFVDLEILII